MHVPLLRVTEKAGAWALASSAAAAFLYLLLGLLPALLLLAVVARSAAATDTGPRRESGPPKHLLRYLPFVPATLVQETTSFLNDSSKLRSLLQLIFSPADVQTPISEKDRAEYQQALERYMCIREMHTGFYRRHESAAAAAMWKAIEALPADLYEEAVQSVTYAPPAAATPGTPKSASSSVATFAEEATVDSGEGAAGDVAAAAGEEEVPVEEKKRKKHEREKKDRDFYIKPYIFPRALMFHELYKDQLLQSLSPFEKRKLQVYMNIMHLRYPHAELKRDQPALFWLPEKQVLSRQREGARKGRRAQK